MKIVDGQILMFFSQVLYRHAEIVSGAYKLRKVYHGTDVLPENEFTDEEKLKDALAIMQRQCHNLWECVDLLTEEDK